MSGHSKWATIKRKKAVIDQKRGKAFAKLARQIDVAARQGGGDPASNAALRTIIQKAKAAQMTNDAIDRAIKRATGEAQGANYEAITYEAYAPGGVALLIDILTDNRNRTASDVRAIFSKCGGSMAAPGAVAWQFARKGVILVDRATSEDELMNAVLEQGADDMADDGSVWRVTCDATKVYEVKAALEAAKISVQSAESTMVSAQTVPVTDPSDAKAILKIMDELEEHDDVQDVYSNFDISEQLLEAAAS
ncbi:MAG: YebC/PmpR family DNA-binding transcriptional regulator [Ilumatobacteraceae bacterium]